MTKTTDRRPRVGDVAWEVDWCASIPLDEFGDSDLDGADHRSEGYGNRTAAVERGKCVLPLDAFGVVRITLVQFAAYDDADALRYPHAGYWQTCGETEYLER